MTTVTHGTDLHLEGSQGLAPDDGVWREVHRIVFPSKADIDVLPLYVDFSQSEGYASADTDSMEFVNTGVAESDTEAAGNRRSLTVPAGKRYSLGSYFNAFPASYWRKWTRAEEIRFVGTFSGTAPSRCSSPTPAVPASASRRGASRARRGCPRT